MNFDKKRKRQLGRQYKNEPGYRIFLGKDELNLHPYVFMKKVTREEFAKDYPSPSES
jgi:hypothetical protein